MSLRALAALACLVAPAIAHAGSGKSDFAVAMDIEEKAVTEVDEYTLEGGGDFVRVVVGRFKRGDLTIGGVALVWCDKKQCWLNHVWLGPADTLDTLGLVDLAGKPAAFPTRPYSGYERKLKLAGKPKWPALIVEATTREHTTTASRYGGSVTGDHRRSELTVISLLRKDERNPTVLREVTDEHWPTGAGVNVSFAIAGPGLIDATEQRDIENVSACLRPEPTTTHYKLDENRRYRRTADLGRAGCGSR
ncbi:MAG: hypothetical protein HOV81_41690 [Kofleriaceae bacterium]|nr:hypothetical protein [Kofleriaceae bacterium]